MRKMHELQTEAGSPYDPGRMAPRQREKARAKTYALIPAPSWEHTHRNLTPHPGRKACRRYVGTRGCCLGSECVSIPIATITRRAAHSRIKRPWLPITNGADPSHGRYNESASASARSHFGLHWRTRTGPCTSKPCDGRPEHASPAIWGVRIASEILRASAFGTVSRRG